MSTNFIVKVNKFLESFFLEQHINIVNIKYSLVTNYRLISLLDFVAKLFEKLVFKYISIITSKTTTCFHLCILASPQMTHLLTFNLHNVYLIFTEALDAGKEVYAVFCDTSRVFFIVFGMTDLFANLKLLVFQETS